jgi:hypothetical protein
MSIDKKGRKGRIRQEIPGINFLSWNIFPPEKRSLSLIKKKSLQSMEALFFEKEAHLFQ